MQACFQLVATTRAMSKDSYEHLFSATGSKTRRWTTGREKHYAEFSTERPGDRERRGEDGRLKMCEAFFPVREKVLPGGIFVKEKGFVSITTD